MVMAHLSLKAELLAQFWAPAGRWAILQAGGLRVVQPGTLALWQGPGTSTQLTHSEAAAQRL